MNDQVRPVGTLRPSQLLWSFGPGAVVDLPRLSVVVMGLDRWNADAAQEVIEPRLLEAVRNHSSGLSHGVRRLLEPKVPPEGIDGFGRDFDAARRHGIPVSPFPQWLRCPVCQRLARADSGVFDLRTDDWYWDRVAYVHSGCSKATGRRKPEAVPARFLVACENGHLDDFPWSYFVHSGKSGCPGSLRFNERGNSLETEDLWVECDECGAKRSMAQAFGEAQQGNLPKCRGRHPHMLQFNTSCDKPLRPILLGASNAWFPVTLSSLTLPRDVSPIQRVVEANMGLFTTVPNETVLQVVLDSMRQVPGVDQRIFDYSAPDLFAALVELRAADADQTSRSDTIDLKAPEWELFSGITDVVDKENLLARPEPAPDRFRSQMAAVLRLERVREVQTIVGFTRVTPPDEEIEQDEYSAVVPLGSDTVDWLPASVVRGEGVLLRFDSDAVRQWMKRDTVKERMQYLERGHRQYRTQRRALDASAGFPGIVYAMLHTLSHLLVRELSIACGYNAASIRERIYANDEPADGMAGILLYTASPDSDGTLGGLVDLGRANKLGPLLDGALQRAIACSSDPLCSEHVADEDATLHNVACHSCVFVPETSCEMSNRYLDRALVVPLPGMEHASFFEVRD